MVKLYGFPIKGNGHVPVHMDLYIHCKDSHYRMGTIFIIFHHHLGNLTLAHVFSPWDKTKSCSPKLESWWAPNRMSCR